MKPLLNSARQPGRNLERHETSTTSFTHSHMLWHKKPTTKQNYEIMHKAIVLILMILPIVCTGQKSPIGKPGLTMAYISEAKDLPGSVVRKFRLTLGAVKEKNGVPYQWFQLNAVKENNQTFSIWILSSDYPSESVKTAQDNILRYNL